MTKTHELKTWPAPFKAIVAGVKTHEIRKVDRDFQVGDQLLLRGWDPLTPTYSGAAQLVDVTYLSPPATWGLPADLCVMSIRKAVAHG